MSTASSQGQHRPQVQRRAHGVRVAVDAVEGDARPDQIAGLGRQAFAVATLAEGIALRKAGVRGTVLILGYTNTPSKCSTLAPPRTKTMHQGWRI